MLAGHAEDSQGTIGEAGWISSRPPSVVHALHGAIFKTLGASVVERVCT